MQEEIETEKIETQELIIDEKFKQLDEKQAEELAEENFIFCDFSDNEPVLGKLGNLEMFRVFSYQALFRELTSVDEKVKDATVTLYLVDDELQEEEAFLKVKLCPDTNTISKNQNQETTH